MKKYALLLLFFSFIACKKNSPTSEKFMPAKKNDNSNNKIENPPKNSKDTPEKTLQVPLEGALYTIDDPFFSFSHINHKEMKIQLYTKNNTFFTFTLKKDPEAGWFYLFKPEDTNPIGRLHSKKNNTFTLSLDNIFFFSAENLLLRPASLLESTQYISCMPIAKQVTCDAPSQDGSNDNHASSHNGNSTPDDSSEGTSDNPLQEAQEALTTEIPTPPASPEENLTGSSFYYPKVPVFTPINLQQQTPATDENNTNAPATSKKTSQPVRFLPIQYEEPSAPELCSEITEMTLPHVSEEPYGDSITCLDKEEQSIASTSTQPAPTASEIPTPGFPAPDQSGFSHHFQPTIEANAPAFSVQMNPFY